MALKNGFVYDDLYTVSGNLWIRDIRHIPEIFSSGAFPYLQMDQKMPTGHYRPMMHLIFMANYHIFGLKAWGFHLTNIIFHSLNAVLVYLIAAALLKGKIEAQPRLSLESQQAGSAAGASSPLPPFMAAMIFVVHPIQTEAVIFISDITDVSYAFFYLLAFYFYIREKTVAALVSLFLSTLCKETAVTFPLMIVAYDYFFKGGKRHSFSFGGFFRRYALFFIVVGVFLILRVNAMADVPPIKPPLKLSSWQYFINIFPLFAKHLEKLLLPVNLNVFYLFHPIKGIFEWWKGIASLLITAGFLSLICLLWDRSKAAVFSLLWMVIPLLPGFYIPVLSDNVFAERRLYLPALGFSVLLAIGLASFPHPRFIKRRHSLPAVLIPFLIITAAYSLGTVKRSAVWKDSQSLWEDAARKSPDGYVPHVNLGIAYEEKGQVGSAFTEYETALAIDPGRYNAHVRLGRIYAKFGRLDDAALEYKTAIKIDPTLIGVYNDLGDVYYSKGMFSEAIGVFRSAIRVDRNFYKLHYNLARAYAGAGDINSAIMEYRTALILKPNFIAAYNELGNSLYLKGRLDDAIRQFKAALKFEPDSVKTHNSLAMAYKAKGMPEKVVEHQNIANRLKQASNGK